MTDNPKKPTFLGRALTIQGAIPEGNKTLGGALARREKTSTLLAKGPATSNLAHVHKAVAASAHTVAAHEVDKRSLHKGICFLIDCTESRAETWDLAQQTMSEIFKALDMQSAPEIGIVIHRGESVSHLGWFKKAEDARREMSEISCLRGRTRIIPGLSAAMVREENIKPSSIIMIGDCFEETQEHLEQIGQQLNTQGIPVRAFHESNDSQGKWAYRRIAEITGGLFAEFGPGCASSLKDLCVAAAVYDIGGLTAFDRLLGSGHRGARVLADSLKKVAIGYTGPSLR